MAAVPQNGFTSDLVPGVSEEGIPCFYRCIICDFEQPVDVPEYFDSCRKCNGLVILSNTMQPITSHNFANSPWKSADTSGSQPVRQPRLYALNRSSDGLLLFLSLLGSGLIRKNGAGFEFEDDNDEKADSWDLDGFERWLNRLLLGLGIVRNLYLVAKRHKDDDTANLVLAEEVIDHDYLTQWHHCAANDTAATGCQVQWNQDLINYNTIYRDEIRTLVMLDLPLLEILRLSREGAGLPSYVLDQVLNQKQKWYWRFAVHEEF
ncbi:uncharacterized protein PAC_17414 [Phialocephala subalpina]|uniref:Uncharacterized protein n=1 Tax=Phialocephala subalpina TaxID=576137 RepID=A0A1L7XR82_9HELO|nr:uncharacterized protein PAC_17414 [Phialocephala subalpina]